MQDGALFRSSGSRCQDVRLVVDEAQESWTNVVPDPHPTAQAVVGAREHLLASIQHAHELSAQVIDETTVDKGSREVTAEDLVSVVVVRVQECAVRLELVRVAVDV